MKTLSRLIIAVLLATTAASAFPRGRVHFGVHIGPYWGPWWVAPPPVYYAAPVVVEREAPIIIEQTVAPIDYWYFCRPADAYYPYVRDCPAAWEKVPAQPSR
jgi:hypothetical protein